VTHNGSHEGQILTPLASVLSPNLSIDAGQVGPASSGEFTAPRS